MSSPLKKIAKVSDNFLGTRFASPERDDVIDEPPHPEASPGKRAIIEGPKKGGKMSFQHVAVLPERCMRHISDQLVNRAGQQEVTVDKPSKECQIWQSASNERWVVCLSRVCVHSKTNGATVDNSVDAGTP